MPSTIKDVQCFRAAKSHTLILNSAPYKRHKGKLMRLLLDAYLCGELPLIQLRFEKYLKGDSNKNGTPVSK